MTHVPISLQISCPLVVCRAVAAIYLCTRKVIHICICIRIYIYTYGYVYTFVYICMYVCMYICACAYIMYICVCVYIGIHFYVYLCIRSKKARKQAIKYSKPYLHTNFVCLSGELWGALRRFGEPWGTSGNSKILGNPICDPASARFFEGRQIWEVRFERTCFKGFMRSLV